MSTRPFLHFEKTKDHPSAGVLFIGKFVLPVQALLAGVFVLTFLVLLVVSTVMSIVTGNPQYFLILVIGILALGLMTLLVLYIFLFIEMGKTLIRSVKKANSPEKWDKEY